MMSPSVTSAGQAVVRQLIYALKHIMKAYCVIMCNCHISVWVYVSFFIGGTETSASSNIWILLAVTVVLATLVVLLSAALVAALIAVNRLRHTIKHIPIQDNVAYLELKQKAKRLKSSAPEGTASPPVYETVRK